MFKSLINFPPFWISGDIVVWLAQKLDIDLLNKVYNVKVSDADIHGTGSPLVNNTNGGTEPLILAF